MFFWVIINYELEELDFILFINFRDLFKLIGVLNLKRVVFFVECYELWEDD